MPVDSTIAWLYSLYCRAAWPSFGSVAVWRWLQQRCASTLAPLSAWLGGARCELPPAASWLRRCQTPPALSLAVPIGRCSAPSLLHVVLGVGTCADARGSLGGLDYADCRLLARHPLDPPLPASPCTQLSRCSDRSSRNFTVARRRCRSSWLSLAWLSLGAVVAWLHSGSGVLARWCCSRQGAMAIAAGFHETCCLLVPPSPGYTRTQLGGLFVSVIARVCRCSALSSLRRSSRGVPTCSCISQRGKGVPAAGSTARRRMAQLSPSSTDPASQLMGLIVAQRCHRSATAA